MPADAQTARDDVAFLRSLIDSGEGILRGFGLTYLAAGLAYGGEMVLHGAQLAGLLATSGFVGLAIIIGPTTVFLAALTWIWWRGRNARPPAAVGRAIQAVFAVTGLANLAMVLVIGSVAWREHAFTTWLIYPCAAFILQGAAWCVAAILRRRLWMGAVGVGWLATAIAMGFSVEAMGLYVTFAGLGVLVCMALPGWVMLRISHHGATLAPAVA